MTNTGTQYTAWATTGYSMPDAAPGISITSSTTDEDGYREEDGIWVAVSEDLPDDWGKDDDGSGLNWFVADVTLGDLGWSRVGDWVDSGGQWGADVVPAVPACVAELAAASDYCTARERDYVVELRSAFEQIELEGPSALPDWVTGEQLMVWGEAAVLWRQRGRIVQAVRDAVCDAAGA